MDEKLLSLAFELHDSLVNDPRILRLNQLEKEMEEDKEVQALTLLKDKENEHYNEMVKLYGEDSLNTKEACLRFYEAKKALESHPKVQNYLKAFQVVRVLYSQINDILFRPYQENLCPQKEH